MRAELAQTKRSRARATLFANKRMNPGNWFNWTLALNGIVVAGTVLLKIIIASAIYQNARRRASTIGCSLRFFQPLTWGFVGLVGGILALALYWLMHYSTLAKEGAE